MNNLRLLREGRIILAFPYGIAIYKDYPHSVKSFKTILKSNEVIYSIGDIVTQNLLKENVPVRIAIVDYKTQRGIYIRSLFRMHFSKIVKCYNPPGLLTTETLDIVYKAIESSCNGEKILIEVKGEEDLLVLPMLFLCPPNSVIVYGHWKGSLNVLHCSPILKSTARIILRRYFVPET